jgi:negative regulator of sigma E activity
MRRRETTLDPTVVAELEALEAALAGEPAAEPELAALVRDVRAQAPAMEPGFRARLDERVEQGFAKAPRPRRRRWRRGNLVPALGVAGCVLAAIVAVVLTSGGKNDEVQNMSGTVKGGPALTQEDQAASGGAGSSSAATPAAPALRARRVERTTRLELTTTDVQKAADGVVRATQAAGGFVQSSQVASGDGRGSASFVLRVPTDRLDDALARLSRLGHVRSLQQSAQDITGAYDSASSRLAEARAERRGLLRALGKASTAEEISSLRARIADNRRDLQRYQAAFNALRRRANLATVEVEVVGRPRKQQPAPGGGSWSPGDAAHDAVRVLEVSAGVALVGLAVLVPLALLGAASGLAVGAYRRRRREAALSTQ